MDAPPLPPTIAAVTAAAAEVSRRSPSLESLPLECIQAILENLSTDCHALYSLLLVNRSWFQMVIPFLYRSPMALIDATWPKVSRYSWVLKKELPQPPPSSPSLLPTGVATGQAGTAGDALGSTSAPDELRSRSQTRRTSTTSSIVGGYGVGYAPRTHSRSSSHSSTRSWAGDAFSHGRNDAVLQKGQRERLVKRKKMQLLWVLLNCTLSPDEHEARLSVDPSTLGTASVSDDEDRHRKIISSSSLLSLDLNSELDIDVGYFKPMVDYLSYYTHFYHSGIPFIIWKLFPRIDHAFTIEWRLISHCPERIRELFLESVQMQDLTPLVSRLETLHRIKTCHESWDDVPGSIEFMEQHNQLFGTIRMLELEAYLPDSHDTPMDEGLGDLIAQVNHLKVLELAGFESLRAQLDLIPRKDLKVLRLNCGKLSPEHPSNPLSSIENAEIGIEGTMGTAAHNSRMSVSVLLSRCRQLEELLLEPVDENVLEWAVQERRDFEAGLLTSVSSSPPSSLMLANEPPSSLVPLKVLELSGTDSEHVAMTICQAAEAFQDTLEVIKANSYSFNRTLNYISWRNPMPRLRVFKIVGRSNLPFDFRSLQYCPALRILDLSKYSGMRACSEALLLNLKYLTRLEYLGLSSFDHLTDSTLRTILGCMPRLKHLRLAIGDSSVSSSTLASSALSSTAAPSSNTSGGARGSGIMGSGAGTGACSRNSSGSTSAAGVSGGADMLNRSPFAALSLSPSTVASSASSPVSSSATASPIAMDQHQLQQPSLGTTYIVTGQIQNQYSPHNYYNQSVPPPSSSSSSTPYAGAGTSGNYISCSSSSSSQTGAGEIASSARSTSSLMDRFHLENNYLSLEGILDAIDGLSESKDQLEKLSIVLGKLDFGEHYRRLEQYNLQHPELEITVYRYAHTV
ncbi:hypothetical protein EDD21DRAFT_373616 [Dissophora ornata]|nr:hypothetical protein EDD21DRAFT_373616 [Dissophora ornata]